MYPFLRLVKELVKFRAAAPLPITGTHVSQHRCWPWDLDFMLELNNGRTLTFYDLGRVVLARRTGLYAALQRNRWGITVAGNSLRYRRRVRVFDRIEMHSRCLGWDARFFYMEQSMWCRDTCTSHMLLRGAVTDPDGIVAPTRVLAALSQGDPPDSPPLPAWVQAWIAADATRPWPPPR